MGQKQVVLKPLQKLLHTATWTVMRQKTMCFLFTWSSRVREKQFNAAWKIYESGAFHYKIALAGSTGSSIASKRKIYESEERSDMDLAHIWWKLFREDQRNESVCAQRGFLFTHTKPILCPHCACATSLHQMWARPSRDLAQLWWKLFSKKGETLLLVLNFCSKRPWFLLDKLIFHQSCARSALRLIYQ